jgi:invasion protein IalB
LADPAAPRAFEDWRLTCEGESCAIYTLVAAADGSEALRLEVRDAEPALEIRTPLPLLLPEGLVVALGARERAAEWRTCDARGCVARLALDPELAEALRREREGSVTLTLVDGVAVRLPVSLLGYTAATRARAELGP